ncbi:MAG: transcriptional regulator NrdR [Solirubrobacteraceae bacterium]|jgi:transcriptional repressor NrdR
MDCLACQARTRVIETRTADDRTAVRRRRVCSGCGRRFTTYERYERGGLAVRKRGGRREAFDRAKLLGGLLRASHKRPVDRERLEALADRIEREVERAGGELPAQRVGDMALGGLRDLDRVAYLQFAAVYKGFSDPSQFSSELAALQGSATRAGSGVRLAGDDPRSPANALDRRGHDG